MQDLDTVFGALSRSSFRARFRLTAPDRDYLRRRGMATVLAHASDWVDRRLAPAMPRNDGAQTPMRGHPAFTAQHATATCCRGCLARWHRIPSGRELTTAERQYIVAAIGRWLAQMVDMETAAPQSCPAGTAITAVARRSRRSGAASANAQADLFGGGHGVATEKSDMPAGRAGASVHLFRETLP
jgi:hypothetical protein